MSERKGIRKFSETFYAEDAETPVNRTGDGVALLDPALAKQRAKARRWFATRCGRGRA